MPAAVKKTKSSSTTSSPASAKGKAKVVSAEASTSTSTLIDSRVSSTQALKALKALKALQSHRKKHKASQIEQSKETGKSILPLDGDEDDDDASQSKTDDMVYVNVTVKRLAKEKKTKPVQVPLPNPLNPLGSTAVCLFVKDPQRTYKDLLPTLGINCVHRIVGVSKLKGKFAPFEARRNLMDEYDVFLCDERISPMMPALLGNKWMQKKKLPLNVNVTRTKHLKEEIEKSIGSTRFFSNKGSNLSVPIGSLNAYSPEQLLENLSMALPKIASKVPYEGWKNIQNVEIKTGKSASLPIWNSDLNERWEGIPDATMEDDLPFAEPVVEEEVVKTTTKSPKNNIKVESSAEKKTKSSTQSIKSSAKASGAGVVKSKAGKSKK
ncbi:unnamed protein product [Sympodiomycopsis kandeliae]